MFSRVKPVLSSKHAVEFPATIDWLNEWVIVEGQPPGAAVAVRSGVPSLDLRFIVTGTSRRSIPWFVNSITYASPPCLDVGDNCVSLPLKWPEKDSPSADFSATRRDDLSGWPNTFENALKPTDAKKTPQTHAIRPTKTRRLENAGCEVDFFFMDEIWGKESEH